MTAPIGILITNLGTPDAPETGALRRYLKTFLSDRRVVELSPWLWQPILRSIILNSRPARSAAAYRKVWTQQGSPLLVTSQAQLAALQDYLQAHTERPLELALGMRYGHPGIPAAIDQLCQAGVQDILVLPLYPQYAASTTASTFDALARHGMGMRNLPGLSFIRSYADHPGYIQALANSVHDFQAQHGKPDKLLMSFHGIPQDYADQGDPYPEECATTARLLAAALDLPEDRWLMSFQSRFGPKAWLKPYTDVTLADWGHSGTKDVQVICPGFSADCLETIEEIGEENRDVFLQAGGQQFGYIPALNERPDHIEALGQLLLQRLEAYP
jgi:ferrochelatase